MMNRVRILKEHWPKEIKLSENVKIKKLELDEMVKPYKGLIAKVGVVSDDNLDVFNEELQKIVEGMQDKELEVDIKYSITVLKGKLVNSAFVIGRTQ